MNLWDRLTFLLPGVPPGYDQQKDRFRDFRAVLTGPEPATEDQKDVVLRQILMEAEVDRDPGSRDTAEANYHLGKRALALWILDVLTREPEEEGGVQIERQQEVW